MGKLCDRNWTEDILHNLTLPQKGYENRQQLGQRKMEKKFGVRRKGGKLGVTDEKH